jgi:hypothetical protein
MWRRWKTKEAIYAENAAGCRVLGDGWKIARAPSELKRDTKSNFARFLLKTYH